MARGIAVAKASTRARGSCDACSGIAAVAAARGLECRDGGQSGHKLNDPPTVMRSQGSEALSGTWPRSLLTGRPRAGHGAGKSPAPLDPPHQIQKTDAIPIRSDFKYHRELISGQFR